MTQQMVNWRAARLKDEGTSLDEIKKALFNTKGVKLAQIKKAMAQVSA